MQSSKRMPYPRPKGGEMKGRGKGHQGQDNAKSLLPATTIHLGERRKEKDVFLVGSVGGVWGGGGGLWFDFLIALARGGKRTFFVGTTSSLTKQSFHDPGD